MHEVVLGQEDLRDRHAVTAKHLRVSSQQAPLPHGGRGLQGRDIVRSNRQLEGAEAGCDRARRNEDDIEPLLASS